MGPPGLWPRQTSTKTFFYVLDCVRVALNVFCILKQKKKLYIYSLDVGVWNRVLLFSAIETDQRPDFLVG